MTDEKLAEKYARENKKIIQCSCHNYDSEKDLEEAYLAGLKAARKEMWHDLRENPNDLPEENQEVLVLFTLPDKSKNDVITAQFENNDFNFVDLQDVIAWCEIPTF